MYLQQKPYFLQLPQLNAYFSHGFYEINESQQYLDENSKLKHYYV